MTTPLAYQRDHALNAICPYFTMFPLEYPVGILRRYQRSAPVVLDPFCGRGTTIYAARRLGMVSYGLDVSPIAVAVAQAKLSSAPLDEVLDLASRFVATRAKRVPTSPFFQRAYSTHTLSELCSLREGLLGVKKENGASVLLRAAALGCLHGPLSKDPSRAGYFSNQMPRTFASKPSYSVSFWSKRRLSPPRVSVVDVLRRKLARIPRLEEPVVGSFRHVRCADARRAPGYPTLRGPVVVVTSPPYYGMRTYLQDQWLRNWFLGGPEEIDYEADVQVRHSSHETFARDLGRVWSQVRRRTDDVHLHVRFGTISSVKSDARSLFRASLKESGGWRLVSTRHARTASSGRRQANQMEPDSLPSDEFDFHAIAD